MKKERIGAPPARSAGGPQGPPLSFSWSFYLFLDFLNILFEFIDSSIDVHDFPDLLKARRDSFGTSWASPPSFAKYPSSTEAALFFDLGSFGIQQMNQIKKSNWGPGSKHNFPESPKVSFFDQLPGF